MRSLINVDSINSGEINSTPLVILALFREAVDGERGTTKRRHAAVCGVTSELLIIARERVGRAKSNTRDESEYAAKWIVASVHSAGKMTGDAT